MRREKVEENRDASMPGSKEKRKKGGKREVIKDFRATLLLFRCGCLSLLSAAEPGHKQPACLLKRPSARLPFLQDIVCQANF